MHLRQLEDSYSANSWQTQLTHWPASVEFNNIDWLCCQSLVVVGIFLFWLAVRVKWNSNSLVSFSRYSLPLLQQRLLTATHPPTNLELHVAPRASKANRKCIEVGCGTNPRYLQILPLQALKINTAAGLPRHLSVLFAILQWEQVILQFLQTAASSPRSEARRVASAK